MKKTYIKPSMEEHKIQTMGMLATSQIPTSDETPSEWGAPELLLIEME